MEVAGEVLAGENPTFSGQEAERELKSRRPEADQTDDEQRRLDPLRSQRLDHDHELGRRADLG
jgi:hypothetical protein